MKINTRARYALRMIMDIAKHSGSEPVPLKDVAGRQNISKRYLAQLTIPLRSASILKSVWGMNGGYMLTKPPSDIRILDIVEAMDGPISIIDCVTDPNICINIEYCKCRPVYLLINKSINDVLGKYTIADLMDGNCKDEIGEAITALTDGAPNESDE